MSPDGDMVALPDRVDEVLPRHLEEGCLSVVVFGPGHGEAIVVRFPDGRYGVVDGCRGPKRRDQRGRVTGDPVRELLHRVEDERELAPNTLPLAFVCLTHAHDDHYKGTGDLLRDYGEHVRRLWQTPFGTRGLQELLTYVRLTRAGRDPVPDAHEPDALGLFISEARAINQRDRAAIGFVSPGRPLLSETVLEHQLDVRGCGPSDGDLLRAQDELMFAMEQLHSEGTTPRGPDPNLTSGALLIKWADASVLLGGDLLCGRDGSGWSGAHAHVDGPVQAVNCAHHASEAAHDAELWARVRPRLAIVTPFKHALTDRRDTSFPPRPETIRGLASDCVVAITSPPRWDLAPDVPVAHTGIRPPGPLAGNGVLQVQRTGGDAAKRNAVAVSLSADGRICRLVLAGQADLYDVRPDTEPIAPEPRSQGG